jgi:WD40 repeat protein
VAWAPSGVWLATCDDDGQVFIWDCRAIDRPTLKARLETGKSNLRLLHWNADQRRLLALAQSGECLLWHTSEFGIEPWKPLIP